MNREKPLLMLTYLALSGPQLRRDVARRFWPAASDAMNSLSVALGQIRKAAPDVVQATETQVSAHLDCDAIEFGQAAQTRNLKAARALYGGSFLAALTLDDLGEELEEWVMQTREALAGQYRDLLLHWAKASLPTSPDEAGRLAAEAYRLPDATPLSARELGDIHRLLSAASHPDAARAAREAAELGFPLQVAPTLPVLSLLGRQAELERLSSLHSGESLWLRGAMGMGKTALLRAAVQGPLLNGTLLSGRSGRPFQTLLPLTADPPSTEKGWLEVLLQHPHSLFVDDWEAADPESRRVLLHLAHSRAGGPLVIASRERPPTALPEVVLRPIQAEYLSPEQRGRSAGIPALLSAHTPAALADAYAGLLTPLTPRARQLLACLAVQATVNRPATCQALDLSADQMAELLEGLGRACLLDGSRPLAVPALRAWLDNQPSLETEVLTLLAPHLKVEESLPLYLRAHELTGSSDFAGFQDLLEKHTRTLLGAGKDFEAEVLLAKHALTESNRLLHGRALDALGRYPEAMKLLGGLEKTPLVEAYRGRVLFRLGKVSEAEQAAQEALKGDLEARAQGYNLLGALALAGRDYLRAKSSFEKATGLFLVQGDDLSHLNALCNLAVSMTELGDDLNLVMGSILELADKHAHPQTLLNIGWLVERQGDLERAIRFAARAASLAEEVHQIGTAARAWNNTGTLYQRSGDVSQAAQAYQKAIHLARQAQDIRLLALALGNYAELVESLPVIEEALALLREAGQEDLVAYFEGQRQAFRGRSGQE